MKKIIYFLALSSTLFLLSCGSDHSKQVIDNTDTIADSTEIVKNEQIFQVPSPDEFITLLKTAKAPFKANITAPEKSDFVDPVKQKINLGVYAADMAYLATYNKFQETVKYFSKVKSLSDQIGITQAIDKATFDRLEKNVTNVDSITSITNNSFYNVIDKLQQNDDGHTLALISYGGWIESMYIAFQLCGNFNAQNRIVQRIASQKIVLENLIGMFESLQDKHSVENVLSELKTIKQSMDKITYTVEEIPQTKDTTRVIIGGKTTYSIDKDIFKQLKDTIEAIRNKMINPA